jgi:hypothetical protein
MPVRVDFVRLVLPSLPRRYQPSQQVQATFVRRQPQYRSIHQQVIGQDITIASFIFSSARYSTITGKYSREHKPARFNRIIFLFHAAAIID